MFVLIILAVLIIWLVWLLLFGGGITKKSFLYKYTHGFSRNSKRVAFLILLVSVAALIFAPLPIRDASKHEPPRGDTVNYGVIGKMASQGGVFIDQSTNHIQLSVSLDQRAAAFGTNLSSYRLLTEERYQADIKEAEARGVTKYKSENPDGGLGFVPDLSSNQSQRTLIDGLDKMYHGGFAVYGVKRRGALLELSEAGLTPQLRKELLEAEVLPIYEDREIVGFEVKHGVINFAPGVKFNSNTIGVGAELGKSYTIIYFGNYRLELVPVSTSGESIIVSLGIRRDTPNESRAALAAYIEQATRDLRRNAENYYSTDPSGRGYFVKAKPGIQDVAQIFYPELKPVGSSAFDLSSLVDPLALLSEIEKGTRPIDHLLRGHFEDLIDYASQLGDIPAALAALGPHVVLKLNSLINGGAIYSDSVFAGVLLDTDTAALLKGTPTHHDVGRLNRQFLQSAYPQHFTRGNGR